MSDQFIDHKYRRGLLEKPHPYNQGKHQPEEMKVADLVAHRQFTCPDCGTVEYYPFSEAPDFLWCHGDGTVEGVEP